MASKPAFSETRRARLERKEALILEAARSVFVTAGFDGARMSEIARRAEIGEGTIYSYYESKAELMLAVLQQFWDGLTREAEAVMASVEAPDFLVRLEALARYHLATVIRNADFINLTFALRRTNSEVSVSRDHLRQYVAVFDRLFLRGQDRGELRQDAVLWQARDVFYGALEYSARSIEVTMDSPRPDREQQPVVDQMVALFRAHYAIDRATARTESHAANRVERKLDQLSDQLAALEKRLP
ncbi:transcriptional regulator, TetR family [Parasphingorhabdus marina DSM 22363]|uniref:Transcriptional regulator, TetR family n=1 Tax=Parasphingorhabdus marina DSM 22363 TaxID=1123272 RepID=A0A1N6CPP9_9SPHN|nr:TetR/AcrR family transcriptional regulator [Parasphingorhabdus marina]SIN60344.1 transcriptional regulator, TetR family [Parasphingorhabdus marina DSM 22363]